MARGWESKSIEAQQEEATRSRSTGPTLTDAERLRQARRQTIELARAKAAADLDKATAPAHRRMLENAVKALDDRLGEI